MEPRVLVAFASKHGSTAEIAEAIGVALREDGLAVDVTPVRRVSTLTGYDAVVAGSAVYHGRWQGDGTDFLKRFERDLRRRPTWLFSSGPTGGSPDLDAKVAEASVSETAQAAPKDVAKRAAAIGARGHATFPGRITVEMTGLLERWMPRGDWRDFDRIRSWATAVGADIRRSAAPQGGAR